jgi:hypothetical protein
VARRRGRCALEIAGGVEYLGDRAGGARAGDAARIETVEHLACEVGCQGPTREGAECDDADQRALEGAHVRADSLRDRCQRSGIGDIDVVVLRALAQDCEAGGEVGWGYIGDEARLEALAQTVLERLEITRRTVGGEDYLASAVVQGVERVEELLLGLGLALEELHVVEQQYVDVAEAGLE